MSGTTINSYLQNGKYGVTLGSAALTVTNLGTIKASTQYYYSGAFFSGNGTVQNAGIISGYNGIRASASLSAVNTGGIYGRIFGIRDSGSLSLVNTGSIIANGYTGVYAQSGYISNSSTGLISSNFGSAIRFAGNGGTVLNAGSIAGVTGLDAGSANNIALWNTGTITGTAGVYAQSGYVSNSSTGVISSSRYDAVDFTTNGTVDNAGKILSSNNVGVVLVGGLVSNASTGTISGNTDGVYLQKGGTVINAGIIAGGSYAVITNSGSLQLVEEQGGVFHGAVSAKGTGNLLELASAATPGFLDMGASFSGFQTIAFDAGSAWTLAGAATAFDAGQTITGLTAGDTLMLENVTASYSNFANNLLTLSNGDVIDLQGSFTGSNFTITNVGANTDIIVCFYPGTSIATPAGAVAVETLQPGDLVLTANGAKPVRWLGRSDISTRFADPLRALPIRIKTGALGGGLPLRDLLVSPDHALFIDGILAQAGALVNGTSIIRERNVPAQFSYYHIELDSHELLLAEGALTESFVDNTSRMAFANWAERPGDVAITELPYPRAKSARQLPTGIRRLVGLHITAAA